MINLIPPPEKKKIIVEYWIRVVSLWFILISFVLLLGTLIMLPVYVLIGTQISLKEEAAIEASERVDSYENVSIDLNRASQQAKYVIEESRFSLFSEYIYLFEELQQSSIEIYDISLHRGQEGIEPIVISGEATDRQTLASFRDRLLAEEYIEEVDLPISNLARDKDILFTLTIVLNKV